MCIPKEEIEAMKALIKFDDVGMYIEKPISVPEELTVQVWENVFKMISNTYKKL